MTTTIGMTSLDGISSATGAAGERYLAALKMRLARTKAEKSALERMPWGLRTLGLTGDAFVTMLLGPDGSRNELSAAIKNLAAAKHELELVSNV